ncbi:MAG: hypothetical protein JSS64_01345 [Bacteroidetes bacterium]|nr:hypothetical protein [Bacteroidota bacterium]
MEAKSRLSDQLSERILSGIRKAVKQLVERRAAENGTLVVVVDGKPSEVPAKKLLQQSHNLIHRQ